LLQFIAQSRKTKAPIVLANRQELVLPIEAQQHRDHYEAAQVSLADFPFLGRISKQ
jgi:hypothetical protein